MPQIGTFFPGENGSFHGAIRTITLDVEAEIRPSAKESERAPDYRVIAAAIEFGAAWRKTSRDQREYLSVKLDDPGFAAPVYASLIEADDGEHRLIWSR
jgi:uncharacterized protein (DUF736 family)